ncbi:MAG: SLC13 family permease [Eubacteriales bacterium]|nr:SLC13 family permease [Eubacteriales bacterium]
MDSLTLFALILFAVTYILMFSLQKLRPYIAAVSALIFVVVGSLGVFPSFAYTWRDALSQIDWNVIMMIAGTMGTVYLFIESKMPQKLSDIIITKVSTVKWIIVTLSLFAGIISAFVDNVATVLMIAPVAVALCRKLEISPVTAIICISISSNLQGAATLVGDTTSILLGKAANLDFMDFFFVQGKPGMFWVTEAGALVSALIILWMCRKDNKRVEVSEVTEVKDIVPTFLLVGTVAALILVSFIPYQSNAKPGQFYKPDVTNGLICIAFFIAGVLRQAIKDGKIDVIKAAVGEIDFYTIVLLAGLFVIIGGIQKAGIIDMIGSLLASLSGNGTRGSIFLVYSVIVWVSVLFSAFIDNIPYTATMLPVVAVIAEKLSAAGSVTVPPNLLYFGLLVGATLGGNITPIGASANITGLSLLRREGHEVSSGQFMKYSVPFTLAAVTTGYILLWLIWM